MGARKESFLGSTDAWNIGPKNGQKMTFSANSFRISPEIFSGEICKGIGFLATCGHSADTNRFWTFLFHLFPLQNGIFWRNFVKESGGA